MCALPATHDVRRQWAEAWGRHLKPGGCARPQLPPPTPLLRLPTAAPLRRCARADAAAAFPPRPAGGELVTLIFPVDPEADPTLGPPFPVTPQLYEDLLLPAGFECIELKQVPDSLSHPARAGREWLGRWRWPGAAGGGGGGSAASKF
jgi:hypothetical protein